MEIFLTRSNETLDSISADVAILAGMDAATAKAALVAANPNLADAPARGTLIVIPGRMASTSSRGILRTSGPFLKRTIEAAVAEVVVTATQRSQLADQLQDFPEIVKNVGSSDGASLFTEAVSRLADEIYQTNELARSEEGTVGAAVDEWRKQVAFGESL